MGRYATSATTRKKLIRAAGELFAAHGVEAVSTRAIARKAGENIGSIHYHFGSKEDLHIAVVLHAVNDWKEYPLAEMFEKKWAPRLEQPDGHAEVLCELVDIYFDLLFFRLGPSWKAKLVSLTMIQPHRAREVFLETVMRDHVETLLRIFQRISPELSQQQAKIRIIMFLGPMIFMKSHEEPNSQILLKKTGYPQAFIEEVKQEMKHNALRLFGL